MLLGPTYDADILNVGCMANNSETIENILLQSQVLVKLDMMDTTHTPHKEECYILSMVARPVRGDSPAPVCGGDLVLSRRLTTELSQH